MMVKKMVMMAYGLLFSFAVGVPSGFIYYLCDSLNTWLSSGGPTWELQSKPYLNIKSYLLSKCGVLLVKMFHFHCYT